MKGWFRQQDDDEVVIVAVVVRMIGKVGVAFDGTMSRRI